MADFRSEKDAMPKKSLFISALLLSTGCRLRTPLLELRNTRAFPDEKHSLATAPVPEVPVARSKLAL